MKSVILSGILLLLSVPFFGQRTILDSAEFYGSVRAHLGLYSSRVEMQDNASRIGIGLRRNFKNRFSLRAKMEFSVNLIDNEVSFNASANTSNSLESFFTGVTSPFGSRLGYVGIHHPLYGTLTFGKQWSTYYDISSFTDQFIVFGGEASGTYNTGTDGGNEGTGRADKAILYRNKIKDMQFAVQTQLLGSRFTYGASGYYTFKNELTMGAAFNVAFLDETTKELIYNPKNVAKSFIAGAKLDKDDYYGAATLSFTESETVFYNDTTLVMFDSRGLEFYFHYDFKERIRVNVGFNNLVPVNDPDLISENYKLEYYVLGIAYLFNYKSYVYLEGKFDNSVDAVSRRATNVLTVGFRYDFSFGTGIKVKNKKVMEDLPIESK